MTERIGAYVHIPFCSAVCPYCDFAVVAGRDDQLERYLAAVVLEIRRDRPWKPLDSIYFGGGTPSRMPPSMLGEIISALAEHHGIASGAEISLEANPEDFDDSTGDALVESGFNRISFGAQSFDNNILLQLGRRHDANQISRAVDTARTAGFENVSIDLIYGTPGETDRSWLATLDHAVACGPDHVSCYALTVEPGTPLGREVKAGAPAPDADVQADRFEMADRVLGSAGLSRYEVSNWARPGRECVYNSTVWAQGEYVAYGNSAHRFRDRVRSRNLSRLDGYLAAVEEGRPAVAAEETALVGAELEIDRLFVGLRRSIGADAGSGGRVLLESPDGERLLAAGVISVTDRWIRVDRPLLTDEVLRSVLALDPGSIERAMTVEHREIPDNVLGNA
ncbi:MAG TPA: radical SAM family heme chaperone HemW [Acidimicrobiia bacterium]